MSVFSYSARHWLGVAMISIQKPAVGYHSHPSGRVRHLHRASLSFRLCVGVGIRGILVRTVLLAVADMCYQHLQILSSYDIAFQSANRPCHSRIGVEQQAAAW